jgi:UDP-N-acetylmuramate dehydrogenase
MNIDAIYTALREYIPRNQLLRNESMQRHTSFHIGGPADLLILPADAHQIRHTLLLCQAHSVPLLVMGNGSNLLVRDKGIRGAVLKIADHYGQAWIDGHTLRAQSGILLSTLARHALNASLTGLEFASGIPGTLGGAVFMNAGAYGGEMKDVLLQASILTEAGEMVWLNAADLALGYRTSVLQRTFGIVLEVQLVLQHGDAERVRETMADLARRRREKQPLTYPSAGSAFKRPVGYYAGQLIQDAGLKGMRVGDAQISELHSGFIINLGHATAQDVLTLIGRVQDRVKKTYGVELNPEVRVVGEA